MQETIGPFFQMVRTGATIAGTAGAGFILYHAGRAIYDDVHERLTQARQDKITLDDLEQARQLANVRTIQADAAGRYPLLYGVNGVIRDPSSLRAFTLETVLERWPHLDRVTAELEALRHIVRMNVPNSYHNEHIIGDQLAPGGAEVAGELQAVTLAPSTLDGLLSKYDFVPRLHQVLIGEYIGDDGTAQPLTLDVPKSVHVLATGASGLGKSTLLETIALQLAGLDEVQLAAIDYGSGTFDGMEDALHWKIADSPGLAIALFHELIKLYQERRELYKEVGRVRSLEQYNAATGNGLPFVAVFIDETSALLEHDGTKGPLIELARVGRKYGLGLLLGGTDFKASTLPSEARSNCLARLAFWLEPGLSRSLLNCDAASDESMTVGDLVAKRPGQVGTVRGHTPEVTEAAYRRLAQRHGDGLELRTITDPAPSKSNGHGDGQRWTADQAQEVVERHNNGESDTAIAGALWHPTSYYIGRVRSILADNNNNENAQDPQLDGDHGRGVVVVVADVCEFCGADVAGDTCESCGVYACDGCKVAGVCPDCQEVGA